jgi:hypothetical protein
LVRYATGVSKVSRQVIAFYAGLCLAAAAFNAGFAALFWSLKFVVPAAIFLVLGAAGWWSARR